MNERYRAFESSRQPVGSTFARKQTLFFRVPVTLMAVACPVRLTLREARSGESWR
jgi:hypothetical protein